MRRRPDRRSILDLTRVCNHFAGFDQTSEAMAVGIMMMTAPLLRPTCRVQYLTSE
jgi:hypothetical protein